MRRVIAWLAWVAATTTTAAHADLVIGLGEVVHELAGNGFVVNHGSILGEAESRLVFDEETYVMGSGYFENTLFLGTFAPGNSPGVTTGLNQAFGASATLEIELGGTIPGFGAGRHDQVQDLGTILLEGGPTLKIVPYGGFVPQHGDQFVILTWQTGLIGSFGTMLVDPFYASHGITFHPLVTNPGGAGSLPLVASVPEASAALLVAGASGAAWATRRWRRRTPGFSSAMRPR